MDLPELSSAAVLPLSSTTQADPSACCTSASKLSLLQLLPFGYP